MTDDLKQEVRGLLDLVHGLIGIDEEQQPTRRIAMDVPEAWCLLAAWQHGPSPHPVQELDERTARWLAKSYMRWVLSEHFHLELHDLAMGGHPFLQPPSEAGKPENAPASRSAL